MHLLLGFLFLIGVLVAAAAITIGGIALIRRERGTIHGSGNLGAAMQNLESLFVESKKHVIEAEREEEGESQPSGDPPTKP
ncbi:MAG TPA: hypothetical protein VGA33_03080 [Thermoanaerobaculia bacterium]